MSGCPGDGPPRNTAPETETGGEAGSRPDLHPQRNRAPAWPSAQAGAGSEEPSQRDRCGGKAAHAPETAADRSGGLSPDPARPDGEECAREWSAARAAAGVAAASAPGPDGAAEQTAA